ADTCAAEESDFAAFDERREKVNGLETSLENFSLGRLTNESRRMCVDGIALCAFRSGLFAVYRVAYHIKHSAKSSFAYRHGNRRAGIGDFKVSRKACGVLHGNAAHTVEPEVLCDFERKRLALMLHMQSVLYSRKPFLKPYVDDRTDYLSDSSFHIETIL